MYIVPCSQLDLSDRSMVLCLLLSARKPECCGSYTATSATCTAQVLLGDLGQGHLEEGEDKDTFLSVLKIIIQIWLELDQIRDHT
jgi:hypothetical protein